MSQETRFGVIVMVGICLCLVSGTVAYSQAQSTAAGTVGKEPVLKHARGSFDVKVTPQPPGDTPEGAAIGRMTRDKQFHGDLDAKSKGQMLSAGTAVEGSAGYVAMELVSGTLNGRTGTFVLQHSATMTRGAPQLSITVVPDSGTGQLTGLAGRMSIIIVDGKHSYEFDYTLAESR